MTKEKLLELLESETVYYKNKSQIIVKETDGIWLKGSGRNNYQLVFNPDGSFRIDHNYIYTSPISDVMEDKFFPLRTDAERKLETLIKRYPMTLDEGVELVSINPNTGNPFMSAVKEVFVKQNKALIKVNWFNEEREVEPRDILDMYSIINLIHLIEKKSFNGMGI